MGPTAIPHGNEALDGLLKPTSHGTSAAPPDRGMLSPPSSADHEESSRTMSPAGSTLCTEPALWFDYREAANPVRPGLTEPIGLHQWGPEIHASGPTAILPLDLSRELGCEGPATSPALAAHFLRILPGEAITAPARA